MTKKIKCRNEGCALNNNKESGCNDRGIIELGFCPGYEKLLPLWQFKDKWEDRTKGGHQYVITEKVGDEYFGRVDNKGWTLVRWSEGGQCFSVPKFDLVPKKERVPLKPKRLYGLVDEDDELILVCSKDTKCPEGWRKVKLKLDEGDYPSRP